MLIWARHGRCHFMPKQQSTKTRKALPIKVPKTVDADTIRLALAAATAGRKKVTVDVLPADWPVCLNVCRDARVKVEVVGDHRIRLTPLPTMTDEELAALELFLDFEEILDDERY